MTIEPRPASCLPFLATYPEIDAFIQIQYQGNTYEEMMTISAVEYDWDIVRNHFQEHFNTKLNPYLLHDCSLFLTKIKKITLIFFVVHQILIHLHYLPDLLLQVALLEKWEDLLIPYQKLMVVVQLFQAVPTFQIEPLAIHHIIINNNISLGKGYKD